jgi:hypothetical protein
MAMSPEGLGPENDCAGEARQELSVLLSERAPHINKPANSLTIKITVFLPQIDA